MVPVHLLIVITTEGRGYKGIESYVKRPYRR